MVKAIQGIYKGLSFEDYSAIEAVNHSKLKLMNRSPAHYKHALDNPESKDSKALRIGSALHCAVLEPEKFASEYLVAPKVDRRIKANKEMYEAFVAQNEQKIILDTEEYGTVQAMSFSILSNPTVVKLLKGTERELSIVAEYETQFLKGRLDAHDAKLGIVSDIKTTEDASREGFECSIFKYGYHTQAAMYQLICEELKLPAHDFVFICVEKEPPYAVGVYRLRNDVIAYGREHVVHLLEQLRTSEEANYWPSYGEGIADIALPAWALDKMEKQYGLHSKPA